MRPLAFLLGALAGSAVTPVPAKRLPTRALTLQLQASESLAEVIENTVGEMMDPALAVLPQTTTVQEAIAFLRHHETP